MFFIIICLTYLSIQLNFELISHNFGAKFFFFFNSNLGSLILIILLLSFLVMFSSEFVLAQTSKAVYINNYRKLSLKTSQQAYLNLTVYGVLVFWF